MFHFVPFTNWGLQLASFIQCRWHYNFHIIELIACKACSFYILAWIICICNVFLFLCGFCESQSTFVFHQETMRLMDSLNLKITRRLFLQISLNFKPFDKAASKFYMPIKRQNDILWTVVSLPLLLYCRICIEKFIWHAYRKNAWLSSDCSYVWKWDFNCLFKRDSYWWKNLQLH